jgi:hypothetical protein
MKTFLHIIIGFVIGCALIACVFLLLKEKPANTNELEDQNTAEQVIVTDAVTIPASVDRFEFTKSNDPSSVFFLEKRTYLYTGKEGSYVDPASESNVTGKILFDVKNNKNIVVPRRELMGEDFWGWKVPEGKRLEITAVYGDIPGDGDIMYRENIYIVTDIKEIQ